MSSLSLVPLAVSMVRALLAPRAERGSVTVEQVVVTAGVVVMALLAVAGITKLVLGKIDDMDLNDPPPAPQ